jgi:uncharacterized protein (TIGR02285 family)
MLLRSLLLLSACSVQVNSIQAKPLLIWLQTDWPPHQIVGGAFQGQGTYDLLQQQISAAMPQFEHQTRLVSLARLEQVFVQQEVSACTTGTLYSEQRAQSRLFSGPMAVGPALAVGYIAGQLTQHAAMQPDGADISVLALDRTLVGAYQPNRLYPEVVTPLLQHDGSNLNHYAFTSEVNAAALLASGRVDYVVEYPERMQYYSQLLPEVVALEHRAIVGANVASISYVSCTKDEIGQAAVKAVDQVLATLWQQPEYIQAMQRWLDDSARRRLGTDIQQLQQAALMQLEPRADNTVDSGH